ncbi:hypothetical protein CDEST_13327 [Colletotrichum destructivum]|uniref:Uncharacterized protein n=1 Tax=Colletotrichum destructivum TaxID=34406 RepID=A0AAX4IYR1_9PEZI|nr:hypothetical protein CDEST_13327 [Colletotrichum destructivum]
MSANILLPLDFSSLLLQQTQPREWSLSDPSERLPLGHTPSFHPGKGGLPSKHSARHETLGLQCSSNRLFRRLFTLSRMVSSQWFFAHCPTPITIIPIFEASHTEVVKSYVKSYVKCT